MHGLFECIMTTIKVFPALSFGDFGGNKAPVIPSWRIPTVASIFIGIVHLDRKREPVGIEVLSTFLHTFEPGINEVTFAAGITAVDIHPHLKIQFLLSRWSLFQYATQ